MKARSSISRVGKAKSGGLGIGAAKSSRLTLSGFAARLVGKGLKSGAKGSDKAMKNTPEGNKQRVHAPKTMNDKAFKSTPRYGNGTPDNSLAGFYGQKLTGKPEVRQSVMGKVGSGKASQGQVGAGAQKPVGGGSVNAMGKSKKQVGATGQKVGTVGARNTKDGKKEMAGVNIGKLGKAKTGKNYGLTAKMDREDRMDMKKGTYSAKEEAAEKKPKKKVSAIMKEVHRIRKTMKKPAPYAV